MSISTIMSRINTLEREIVLLEKKISETEKTEAKFKKDILSAEKSINTTMSASIIRSKTNQISQYQAKIARAIDDRGKYHKELAKKKEELSKKRGELAKEQEKVAKKDHQQHERAMNDLQKKIKAQQQQLSKLREEKLDILHQLPQENKEYDFFISHASEDKQDFVQKLADALSKRGASVWYDKFCLKVGSSLRESIDLGLLHSRYGIVVISRNYINKYWTKKELNALFSKESIAENNLILPIWYNISKDEVVDFSPILADKIALITAIQTVDEIADELVSLLDN